MELSTENQNESAQNAPDKRDRIAVLKCPYCRKKIGFFSAWMLRTKGEYFCNECGNLSVVLIRKVAFSMAIAALIVSIVLALVFTFFVDMYFWSVILICIPFFLFFFASVFTVHLKKIAPPGAKHRKLNDADDMQYTRIV